VVLFRELDESKEEFLFKLYNGGAVDLRLCYNYVRDGEVCFTRWVRYDYLMSLEPNEKVHGTIDTRSEFLRKATHRTIHPYELVYDVDSSFFARSSVREASGKNIIVQRYKTYPSIKKLSEAICVRLGTKYKKKAYFTGNKSYHLHVFRQDFLFLNQRTRENKREEELWISGADVQKKSENSMIAIELEPHYRSGKIKCEVQL
jgi:DNA primase catalytic subunit